MAGQGRSRRRLYACYNHVAYLTLPGGGGEPLARVIEEADARIARVGRRVIVARFHCVLERQMARALAGRTVGPRQPERLQSFDESRDLSFICRTTNANQVRLLTTSPGSSCTITGRVPREALVASDQSRPWSVAGRSAASPPRSTSSSSEALALLTVDPVDRPEDLDRSPTTIWRPCIQGWRSRLGGELRS